jgi:hypothetical protein
MAVANRGVVRIIGFANGDRKFDREPDFPDGTGWQPQFNVEAAISAKIHRNFSLVASAGEGQG